MNDDEERRRILERRDRFLRATLYATAGALLTACDPSGAACHSIRRNMPRTFTKVVGCESPHPCLSVAIVDAGAPFAPPDAGGDAPDDR